MTYLITAASFFALGWLIGRWRGRKTANRDADSFLRMLATRARG